MSAGGETTRPDPSIDRRTYIKTLGLAAGAGTVGVGADELGLSPVGRSDAIAVTAAAVIGLGVGAAAGVAVAEYTSSTSEPDTSSTDVLEDSIYNAAVSVAEGRSTWESEMQSNYLASTSGQSPYADAAWSEIRAAAAKEIVNGNSQSDAELAAQNALNRQTRISIHNIAQRYNTAMTALVSHLTADRDNNIGVFQEGNTGNTPGYSSDNFSADWEGVSGAGNGSGEYIMFKSDVISNLPGSPSDVEEIDGPTTIYAYNDTGGGHENVHTGIDTAWGLSDPTSYVLDDSQDRYLQATHPDYSSRTIVDDHLYRKVTARIWTEYQSISSDLNTYVSNLVTALDQGAIDASDIYSPSDLVDQFASSNKRSRVAAELAAVGAHVPESKSWQAKISHPDLSANSLWVDLYPQFSGDPVDLRADMTLSSGDYSLAYIGYTSQADGEYITETLSGGSDLQILDVEGIEGSTDATASAPNSAASDGSINLGSDPPDQIKNPGSYEDTFNLKITTASSGTFTAPVSDVEEQSGDYVLPSGASPLSGSETLDSVEIVPVVQTTQTSQYVADPSTVDSKTVTALLDSQKQMVSKIQELEDEATGATGGSGSLFGDLPTLPGLSAIETYGLAAAGILTLGALN